MADGQRYTLDTSAVVAYFTDEPGAAQVERLLAAAEWGHAEIFASFMTYMEVLYRIWQDRGEREGKVAYIRLKALPIKRLDVSEGLLCGPHESRRRTIFRLPTHGSPPLRQ